MNPDLDSVPDDLRPVWRTYDPATLDREYSPSSCIPDINRYLREYAERSAHARDELPVRRDRRYGRSDAEVYDLFPVRSPRAAAVVYIHGGYWQQLSKNESAFAAPRVCTTGFAFVALNYGLAPAHSLDDMVGMVRRAVQHLAWGAHSRPIPVHLVGHSAGAHLAAMALLEGELRELVASATLLSGVYDLEPIRHTYVDAPLRLTAADAVRNSPIRWLPDDLPPLIIARGANETSEFARQHDDFVAACRGRGGYVEDLVAADRNHFDLPFDVLAPDTELGDAMFGLLTRTGRYAG